MNSATRAAELTALLAEAPTDNTDHEAVRKYIHRLAEAGVAVLFVIPDAKLPADPRTARRRNADDRAAREAAKDAGRRYWEKVKSPAGLELATTDTDVLDGYLAQYVKTYAAKYPDGVPVNLAVEVGGSGLVIVDCDTTAQMTRWADADAGAGAGDGELPAPTVLSPGQVGPTADPDDPATWAHADGGHFWFTVPEGVELPPTLGAATLGATDADSADGFAVLWSQRYVLVPPSTRPEGPYVVAPGGVHELPDWLADKITTYGQARAERAAEWREQAAASDDRITAWGATITWAEILASTKWTPTGKADSCGCETWTAPGDHASPKSATAHEPGCSEADSDDPCLHIWTDHDIEPFGRVVAEHGRHVTRLRAVAAIHHNSNEGDAMSALDLTPPVKAPDELPADFGWKPDDSDSSADIGYVATTDDLPSPPMVGDVVTTESAADKEAAAEADARAAMAAADELFTRSAVLRHIAACADARGSSRTAVLVQVLMRTALVLSPRVVIPAYLGGSDVGLSILAALVGSSSGGKGRAETVGGESVELWSQGKRHQFEAITPATGEGLTSIFAETGKDPVTGRTLTAIHTQSALLGFKDVAGFGSMIGRTGSSLVATLLSLYMGDSLGTVTRDRTRRVVLPAHSVVAGLSVGLQPERSELLFSPELCSDGLPARFVGTPVRAGRKLTTRGMPPEPMAVKLPDFGISTDPNTVESNYAPGEVVTGLVRIDVDTSVADEIRAADEVKDYDPLGRVPEGQNQLLGHANLTRAKLGTLLGVLHGETGLTAPWWQGAGLVMDVSTTTMAWAKIIADGRAGDDAHDKGTLQGRQFAASDQVREDARLKAVADRLAARVGDDWASVNSKACITAKKHDLIPDAWRLLIDTGRVKSREHEYQPGKYTVQYRRVR